MNNILLAKNLRKIAETMTATSPKIANVYIEEDQVTVIKNINLTQQIEAGKFKSEVDSSLREVEEFNKERVIKRIEATGVGVSKTEDFVGAGKAMVYIGIRNVITPKMGGTRMNKLKAALLIDGVNVSIL